MSIIKRVEYLACGHCENWQQHLFTGQEKKRLVFPAGVFLMEHAELGYILYDTGYDDQILSANLKYWLYRLPNPIRMTRAERVDEQLRARGIEPEDIAYVLISHLHPDHIGCLRAFSQATFILTEICYQTYQEPSWGDLVFQEYFPEDFEERVKIVGCKDQTPLSVAGLGQDIFGDGSLWAYSLSGHAAGQLCLWIEEHNLFLAADVVWGMELLAFTEQMKWLPRRIQSSFAAYVQSAEILRQLTKEGVKVVVSHDPEERIREVLNA